MPTRFGNLNNKVTEKLRTLTNGQDHEASQHLYSVSILCGLIAKKRGLDADLCKSAGLLHDLWLYCHLPLGPGEHQKHAEYGSAEAREILTDLGSFTDDEIEIICRMILHHDDKNNQHDEYDEALKDADALQHYLRDSEYDKRYRYHGRHLQVLEELGISLE